MWKTRLLHSILWAGGACPMWLRVEGKERPDQYIKLTSREWLIYRQDQSATLGHTSRTLLRKISGRRNPVLLCDTHCLLWPFNSSEAWPLNFINPLSVPYSVIWTLESPEYFQPITTCAYLVWVWVMWCFHLMLYSSRVHYADTNVQCPTVWFVCPHWVYEPSSLKWLLNSSEEV